jgi:hypothetical protein
MFLHTTTVTVLPGLRLQITFNNGMASGICLLDGSAACAQPAGLEPVTAHRTADSETQGQRVP